MPLRLAVETAFPTVSVALDANGTLLEPGVDLSARRAAGLHAAVADLVHQADATVKNLDEVWVDVGPGSYTGLRVGIALVRTLAELVDVEIKTLRSTDQLARAVQGQMADHADFVVCLDARRNRWYCARYRVASDGLELVEAPTSTTL